MPGSEFRVLPRMPLEFKKYKLVKAGVLGKAMTQGWTPVASVNYQSIVEGQGCVLETRFLIAKEPKTEQAARGSGPMPVLMFPQPEDDAPAGDPEDHVKHVLDQIARMSQEEVLELHQELQAKRANSEHTPDLSDEDDEDDEGVDEVSQAMGELLGDDDGSDDDDEDE